MPPVSTADVTEPWSTPRTVAPDTRAPGLLARLDVSAGLWKLSRQESFDFLTADRAAFSSPLTSLALLPVFASTAAESFESPARRAVSPLEVPLRRAGPPGPEEAGELDRRFPMVSRDVCFALCVVREQEKEGRGICIHNVCTCACVCQ